MFAGAELRSAGGGEEVLFERDGGDGGLGCRPSSRADAGGLGGVGEGAPPQRGF